MLSWFSGAAAWGTDGSGTPQVTGVCGGAPPVPVIASGGIMDGRGLVAALALGASAVQMEQPFWPAKKREPTPLIAKLCRQPAKTKPR
jgi:hypothetical protein